MSAGGYILLVEDSPEDRMATIRAFRKCGVNNEILSCTDGDDALDFLKHEGKYAGLARVGVPSLMLLDLNMPGTDGREVLAIIKADPKLKMIPVVVLTTSGDQRDVQGSYLAGASSYVTKPVDLAAFVETIRKLKEWWLETVVLPMHP
jgi:CheY-like chemotaxis protein